MGKTIWHRGIKNNLKPITNVGFAIDHFETLWRLHP